MKMFCCQHAPISNPKTSSYTGIRQCAPTDFDLEVFLLQCFRFSGVTAELLRGVTTTIREVQAVLLSMVHKDTILVGHSLESDLKATKVSTVVAIKIARNLPSFLLFTLLFEQTFYTYVPKYP